AEARAQCERALALREPLVAAHPETPSYRSRLGEALLRFGQVRREQGDAAGAAADWRRAIALYEATPTLTGERTFLFSCCHAGLSGLAAQAGSGVSAAEGPAEADRAMALLRRAVAAGYRNPAAYRTESALDPLRDRDDFQLLMLDLAMPDDPFAR